MFFLIAYIQGDLIPNINVRLLSAHQNYTQKIFLVEMNFFLDGKLNFSMDNGILSPKTLS